LLRVAQPLDRGGGRRDRAVVKVDADEIERGLHLFEIARLDAHDGLRKKRKRIRIAALERRI
jgi:hypothetical protein